MCLWLKSICESFQIMAKRLMELGLSYLTIDRSASTLSLVSVRGCTCPRGTNRTTGCVYVINEPTQWPTSSQYLRRLTSVTRPGHNGKSVLLVDLTPNHSEADWLIELGPTGRCKTGVVAERDNQERIGSIPPPKVGLSLLEGGVADCGNVALKPPIFRDGRIHLSTTAIHTVKPAGGYSGKAD